MVVVSISSLDTGDIIPSICPTEVSGKCLSTAQVRELRSQLW